MPSDNDPQAIPGAEEAAAAATAEKRDRVFLVVVDDSPERSVAMKYACLRARKGGGRVALLRVVEPVGLVEWAGVGVMMQEERREEAEKLLSGLGAQVQEITGSLPILIIREGEPRDALLALIEEDPRISILVLASATGGGGPGPLISALTGRYAAKLTVPMTIVPGGLDDRELDRVT
jgi:nucleotide-binding universal stress UspA family protein